jgi:uncharacterized protein (DUF849 family)
MVAPNGARRTRADHPAIPLSVDELVRDALACQAAGAGGLHAHVRDSEGQHVLDPHQYRQLLTRMHQESPGFYVQVTSESAGRYTPAQQRAFLRELSPPAVSIAVREFLAADDPAAVRRAYRQADTDIQHILYDVDDAVRLAGAIRDRIVDGAGLKILIVHGSYGDAPTPGKVQLDETLFRTRQLLGETDFAVCSFGPQETIILRHVLANGGKVRVGFENNIHMADGTLATSNAARVREVLPRHETDQTS